MKGKEIIPDSTTVILVIMEEYQERMKEASDWKRKRVNESPTVIRTRKPIYKCLITFR